MCELHDVMCELYDVICELYDVICMLSCFSHVSLWPHGPWLARLLCQWDFPGKNTGVSCHFLLQRIFPTQESNLPLLQCRWILYHWATGEACYTLTRSPRRQRKAYFQKNKKRRREIFSWRQQDNSLRDNISLSILEGVTVTSLLCWTM